MRIALLGGTGEMGEGLALRWAEANEIIVGSREFEKANKAAKRYQSILRERGIEAKILGMENLQAVKLGEIIVFTIPYEHAISTARELRDAFKNQIVISPLVNLNWKGKYCIAQRCAALDLKEALPEGARVISAFQTLPAEKLKNLDLTLDLDVVVCGDDESGKKIVMDLVKQIPNLRPLDGGPLEFSSLIENLTPLLLNLARLNKLKNLSIKFL
ncbi:MAG: NADPH-dependent F420 reductase [Methanocellales archaeon]